MKKLYIYTLSAITGILLSFGSVNAQTITVTDIPPTMCANESFTLSFTASGFTPLGNTYTAELSDETGSFAVPVPIGSVVSDLLTDYIYVTIPAGTFQSPTSAYRIRVVSSSPVITGADNGTDIVINCLTRDYYWTGGSGNWSDLTHWQYTTDGITFNPATEIPTQYDNVNFDNQSFPSGGQLTIDVDADCNDFYWEPGSGAANPVLWANYTTRLNVYGDFELDIGVYRDIYYLYFLSPKFNVSLDFADNLLQASGSTYWKGNLYFQGSGSWDQNSDLIADNITIYNGNTIYTNGFQYNITYSFYNYGNFYADNSSIYATNFSMYGTLDAGTSSIFLGPDPNNNNPILNGTQIYNNLTINGGICTINSGNTFETLNLLNGGVTLAAGSIQTINTSFTAQGTRGTMVVIKSQTPGTQATLAVNGTVAADYVAITDNIIDDGGAGIYTATNAIDGGNNTNWTFSLLAPLEYYWTGDTGNWSDLTKWSTSTDGGLTLTPATDLPGIVDNVNFNANSFPTGGTLTLDQPAAINTMTWEAGSGTTNPTITSTSGTELTLFGDLTMDNGVNRQVNLIFDTNNGIKNVNMADNTNASGNIKFQGGGNLHLQSDLATTGTLYFYEIGFFTNDFTVTMGSGRIQSDLATLNLGSSNIYVNGSFYNYATAPTFNAGTSTFYFNSTWVSRIDGPLAFNNVVIDQVHEMQDDNTFVNLVVNPGATLRIFAGSIQKITGNLSLAGTRGSFVTVESYDYGTPGVGTFQVTGATVLADFLNLADNTIDNGDPLTDVPATNTVDNGNNTGWLITPVTPLDYYWTGDTGNWSDLTKWSTSTDGGLTLTPAVALPGPVDNVNFNAGSFPTGGTLTVDQATTINNMTWETGSGTTNPTIYSDWGIELTIMGNLTMDNGVNRQVNLIFDSSNGSNLINMADNANASGNVRFQGGGSWSLQSDLATTGTIYFYDGTFNTNDFTVTMGSGYIQSGLAILNWGASNVYVNGYLYNFNTSSTFNASTSTFYFNSTWKSGISGPLAFNNVVIDNIHEMQGNNSFATLTVNPGSTLRLFAGSTQTVTGSLTLQGTKSSLVSIESFDSGTPGSGTFQATGATIVADYVSLADNTIDNGLATDVPATNAIDKGNNVGWLITSPTALEYYWTGDTGNWSELAKWSTSTDGGATLTPATELPGAFDNVNFNAGSFPTGGTLTIDQSTTINSMVWETGSGTTNPTIYSNWGTKLTIRGNLTMDNGVARQFHIIFDSSNGTNQINMADNANATGTIEFRGGGSWDLFADLSTNSDLYFYDGTFNTNDFNVTFNSSRIYSDLATLNWGNSNITVNYGIFNSTTSPTFNAGTSTFTFTGNSTTIAGPLSFNNIIINDGTHLIQRDNTFNNVLVKPGVTLQLHTASIQTITNTLVMQGSRSQLIVIETADSGTPGPGTFQVGGTSLAIDFVSVANNTIDNGDPLTDVPVPNGVDNGNNTGWNITPITPLNYYWTGGTGVWSDFNHWQTSSDGGSTFTPATVPPGTVDNVFFTANSFPASGTLTLDQAVTITNMTWEAGSGTTKPRIDANTGSNNLTILGNLTMDNGVIRNVNLVFDSSNGTNQINMADNYNASGSIEFRGGGVWDLQSDLATTSGISFYNGTFNTNDFSISMYNGFIYSNLAILNWGNSDIFITGGFYNYATSPTINAGTSTFYFNSSWKSSIYGPLTFNKVVIDQVHEMQGDNTFAVLTVNPGATLKLFAGSIQTATDSLILQGLRSSLITIESFDYGTAGIGTFQVTGATVVTDFVSLTDNTIDNGDPLTDVPATNSIDNGNNSGWNISPITPFDYYWIGGGGNWSDITHWQTSPDGGTTFVPATEAPGFADNVFFTATSFPDGGALTLDITAHCNNMTWQPGSGSSFPVLFANSPNELVIHGSLQMDNGVTRNLYQITFDSDVTGNTIAMADNLMVSNWGYIDFTGSGEWTLQDSLSIAYLNLRGGVLNTNDQAVNIIYQLYLDNNHTGTVNWGASQVYLQEIYSNAQNLTFNAGTSTFNFANLLGGQARLRGAYPVTFNKVNLLSDTRIYDSFTFNDLTLTAGIILQLDPGLTQTVTNLFNAIGNRSEMIEISSSTTGSASTIAVNTGGGATINIDYLTLQDNILDNGLAADEVANNSIDNGGNTGWDFATNPLTALDYYWVGGSGNWSDVSHWATDINGTSFHPFPPGVIDNVNFTDKSFPAGGEIILDQPAACNNMVWTDGSFNPTITGTFTNYLTIHGNLTVADGVNRNLQKIVFDSQSTNQLIFGDNRFEYSMLEFRGGGTWNLIDSIAVSDFYFYEGTFNTNNNPMTIENEFRISGSDPIDLNFGNSIIRLSRLGGYATNITVNTGNSQIFIVDGGQTYGDAGGFDVIVEGEAWFWGSMFIDNNLTILPGGKLYLNPGQTYTITGDLIANGTRPLPVSILSTQQGTQATITKVSGTVDANYIILQDNMATGGATFNATNAIEKANVSGWNITAITPVNYYWKVANGDWSDVNSWSLSATTDTPPGTPPGPADNIFVTASSAIAGGGTMNLDIPVACNNMTWEAGITGAAIAGDYETPLTIQGSLTLTSAVALNLDNLIFESEAAGNTINMGGSNVYSYITIEFRGSGDWTMADSLSAYRLYLRGGTLNTGGFPLNITSTLNLWGSGSTNPVLNLSNSKVYISNVIDGPGTSSLLAGTSTIYFNDCIIYSSWSFNDAEFDGDMTVYGDNTYNNLTLLPGAQVVLQKTTTQTVNQLIAIGERARPISIKSTEEGIQANLVQASNAVAGEYLILQDNNALGGASFSAQNSIDEGNVSGWNITPITPRDYFWVGGDGKWSEASTHWANADGGTNFYNESPGPLDNVFFTGNSFSSAGTLTLDYPTWVNNMDWTGSAVSVSISGDGEWDNSLTISGSLTLVNGISRDFDRLIFKSDKAGNTISMADNLHSRNRVEFRGANAEWTLTGPIEAYLLDYYNGTFYSNNYDVTSRFIRFYSNAISYWGSSIVKLSYLYNYLNYSSTFNSETSTFNFNDSQSNYIRGESRFYIATFDGDTYIQNKNIFYNATFNTGVIELSENQAFSTLNVKAGTTLSIEEATTQTVSDALTLSGTVNKPIIVNSFTEGEAGIFSAPATCVVTADYVLLQDNTATGGANFTATNSSDFGNVTGWNGLLTGQTIDFAPLSDQPMANGSFTVNATASSSLAVSFEVASGSATISGNTVTPTAAGLVGVRAVQTGDNVTYGSAKPIIRYIHIDATTEPNELGNMKEAKLVLGQPDAVTNDEIYTDVTLPSPSQAAVLPYYGDGSVIKSMLAVANGTRVMLWFKMPADATTPADVVLGHADFTTDLSSGASASTFDDWVYSVGFAGGNLLVGDRSRILVWPVTPSMQSGDAATFVIGQPDLTTTKAGTSSTQFSNDNLIRFTTYDNPATGNTMLIVADGNNNRVLIYDQVPTSTGAAANVVIGQPDFTSSAQGNDADQMYRPYGVAVAPDGKLVVADFRNNRVLVFNSVPTANGIPADVVLGQPDFGYSDSGVGSTSLNGPISVSISRTGKLAITDYYNHRVLIYNSVPTNNSTPPDYILGQPDSVSNVANYNSISGRTLNYPTSADWDISENLLVSDMGNNRLLIYGAADLAAPNQANSVMPSTIVSGAATPGEVTLTDRSGIMSAEIRYRGISSANPAFTGTLPLSKDANSDIWRFDAADLLGSEKLGVEYYLSVTDYMGNTTFGDSATAAINANIRYPGGLSITNFGVGDQQNQYRMFSVPLNLTNKDAMAVFDEINGGTYDTKQFRIFTWPGGPATGSYTEYNSGFNNIELGKGYFALAASGATVSSGEGETPVVSATNPFTITLVPGWNMIGNPYNFTVSWADILAASGITNAEAQPPQTYNGSYVEQTGLASGEGYFVNNPTTGNVTLQIPVVNSTGGRLAGVQENDNPLSESSWEVRFLHQDSEGYEIVLGAVGMEETSEYSFDQYDRINPPAIASQPTVEFSHPEFFQPSFKKDIRPTAGEEKWQFTYTAEATEDLDEIYWDNTYFGISSPDIYLVDKTHFEVINMKEKDSYVFKHGGITRFEVYFGYNALENLLPDDLEVQTPYPNPFTDLVNINVGLPKADNGYKVMVAIYNTMGKQVATLTNGSMDAGYYVFKWQGNNNSGQEVPDGIYAYRVIISGEINKTVTGKIVKN